MGWTPEQETAITAGGTNLLVAAAAGSGKTAVLVERVIRRLLDPDHPADVDGLLVVTFTEAAAAEMRQRIARRLQDELAANPGNGRLQRQLTLLGRASISTLHAFCLSLLRQYFYRLDLDPGFRILGEHEGLLLRQEVLDAVLEEHYTAEPGDEAFLALVERYGGHGADEGLRALILDLYDFTSSQAWPDHWLEQAQARFNLGDDARLEDTDWFRPLVEGVGLELDRALGLLRQAGDLCQRPGGPAGYHDTLGGDAERLAALRAQLTGTTWDGLALAVQGLAFPALRSIRGGEVDPQLQARVKGLRDAAKKIVRDLAQTYLARSAADHLDDLRTLAPVAVTLTRLVTAFGQAYAAAKRARALADFNDLERQAFRLLVHPEAAPGDLRPGEVALELQQRYDEVLVDEYQDINELQDAILALVARDGYADGAPANRFMVGDVKQSIYRFRQAEPRLFQHRYETFGTEPGGNAHGRRIDLRANFRSRQTVVDAVNFIFRQLLRRGIGGVDYDGAAELVYQAGYPEAPTQSGDMPVEVHLLERQDGLAHTLTRATAGAAGGEPVPTALAEAAATAEAAGGDGPGANDAGNGANDAGNGANDAGNGANDAEDDAGNADAADPEEYSALEREAALIATRIRELLQAGTQVWDKGSGTYRPLACRDIVILLRSPRERVNALVDMLSRFDIPAYADVATGYFAATEIETMLALLQVIDNPRQDIPLAAVLHSPVMGLAPAEMAQVRLARKRGDYLDAVVAAAGRDPVDTAATPPVPSDLAERLGAFLDRLEQWRTVARRRPLSHLVWQLYEETGYLHFAGGMPGGAQRRANLLALHDRAREFDQFARQGLFRFLAFIKRLRERQHDLGEAPVLGEAADVVRILSIHKSKGLEFPVVFVADLGKEWNRQDQAGALLFDRDLGLGPMVSDPELRIQYPSLAHHAVKRAQRLAALGEEMRVLYVAMTRARERLILVGSTRGLARRCEQWAGAAGHTGWGLSESEVAGARSFLDWLLPPLARHRDGDPLRRVAVTAAAPADAAVSADSSSWRLQLWPAEAAASWLAATPAGTASAGLPWADLAALRPLPPDLPVAPPDPDLVQRLAWRYPWSGVTAAFAKATVTELKRRFEPMDSEAALLSTAPAAGARPPLRPRFLQTGPTTLTAAERGTVTHLVLQHLDLRGTLDAPAIHRQIAAMVGRELLTAEQAAAVSVADLARFFASDLGQRLQAVPDRVQREVAFSLSLPAHEVYPHLPPDQAGTERVLVQGVIDCLLQDDDGYILVDYKTDRLTAGDTTAAVARQRYGGQVALYRRAVAAIYGQPVRAAYLYFLQAGMAVAI